jgi:hypothetical protein
MEATRLVAHGSCLLFFQLAVLHGIGQGLKKVDAFESLLIIVQLIDCTTNRIECGRQRGQDGCWKKISNCFCLSRAPRNYFGML